MRPLILGASGQVGQALIAVCEARGWDWAGSFHEHPEVLSPSPASGALHPGRTFALDLNDPAAAAACLRERAPDLVFLPSGWTWVDGCEDDPERARRINALAPEAVAGECSRLGAGLVFYSTDYVFGENGGPYGETSPTGPLGVYGSSKLEGEQRVLAACPGALVLRTTVVYGPEPQGKNFVYQLLRTLLAGKPMTLPSDQISTVTYNRDLARASVELAEGRERGLWNVCGPENIGRADFGRLAADCFGLDAGLIRAARTRDLAQKARRPLAAGLLSDKVRGRLGWPMAGPREGLRRMRDEMEAAGKWPRLAGGAA
jgi:dTDP-4-dehydrorhamnose reductase